MNDRGKSVKVLQPSGDGLTSSLCSVSICQKRTDLLRLLSKLFHRKLSKEDFLIRVFSELDQAGVTNIQFDEASFSFSTGPNQRSYLGNVFDACLNADEATRQETIRNFVATVLRLQPAPADYESARQSLMPIIRDPAFNSLLRLEDMLKDSASPDFSHAAQPIAEGLNAGLACDTPHSLIYVNMHKLNSWGVTFAQALQAAKDNLRSRTDPNGLVQQRPGTFLGDWKDSYDSSRMLLTEYLDRLPLKGDPVVFIPNRDRIWITGSSDAEGLEQALRAGKESHFKAGYPLSPNLYRLKDGAWQPFVPEDFALQQLLNSIQRDRGMVDYQQQKASLEKLYEKSQTDIFVASYTKYERKEDNIEFSFCVWSRDADSLLPKTEIIAFMVDIATKDSFKLRWNSAVEVIGHLMEQDPNLFPVRFRVRTFPNESELSQLRKLAVSL